MPVIRVDDEVWKELKKRAEPLVDTPNSVLRKYLKIDGVSANNREKVIDIELTGLHTPRKFALLPVPKSKRWFFPGYKVYFDLETEDEIIKTRITSAPNGTPVGDPDAGAYIQGGLKPWYEKHPELKPGDKLHFETLERGKRYKLSIKRANNRS